MPTQISEPCTMLGTAEPTGIRVAPRERWSPTNTGVKPSVVRMDLMLIPTHQRDLRMGEEKLVGAAPLEGSARI